MERREFARIKVDLLIKFGSLEQIEDMINAEAADLSMGGIFIRTDHVKPRGTGVILVLPTGDGKRVRVNGTVRSIRYENDQKIGMGIQFDKLSDKARQVIKSIVEKQR